MKCEIKEARQIVLIIVSVYFLNNRSSRAQNLKITILEGVKITLNLKLQNDIILIIAKSAFTPMKLQLIRQA